MNILSAKKKFLTIVPNKNIFSPTVLEYGAGEDCVYELSTGYIMEAVIFGVTVVNTRTNEHDNKRSKPFDTLSEASQYIESLK